MKVGNIKDETRKYGTSIRYHETGGGPPPANPAIHVAKMFEIIHGTKGDILTGIGSSMESAIVHTENSFSENYENIDPLSPVPLTPNLKDNLPSIGSLFQSTSRMQPAQKQFFGQKQLSSQKKEVSLGQIREEQLKVLQENLAMLSEQREQNKRAAYKVELEIVKLQHHLYMNGMPMPPFAPPILLKR